MENELVTVDYLDKRLSDLRAEIYRALIVQTLITIGGVVGLLPLFI